MKLEEAFERIVVINLPYKAARRRRLDNHLMEVGIANTKKIIWERAISGDWTPPPAWWGAGNGAWGCLMSHVRIAQDAVHDKVDSYCVLEDDVVFHDRAQSMLYEFIRELPSDWGQVYLGGQFLEREPEIVSPWVLKPFNVNRTHAFALSKATIPHYLQHILHAPDYFEHRLDENGVPKLEHNCFHIDHQLGRAHERMDWKTYAPTWWLAGQEAGSSNISGRKNPRLWWHWRDRGHKLPFFYLPADAGKEACQDFIKYLHVGNNLIGNSLIDVGLKSRLSDHELENWLKMIAGEAVELWKLPGFAIPSDQPDLPQRVRQIWTPGVIETDLTLLASVSDYPFNGYCGGPPTPL